MLILAITEGALIQLVLLLSLGVFAGFALWFRKFRSRQADSPFSDIPPLPAPLQEGRPVLEDVPPPLPATARAGWSPYNPPQSLPPPLPPQAEPDQTRAPGFPRVLVHWVRPIDLAGAGLFFFIYSALIILAASGPAGESSPPLTVSALAGSIVFTLIILAMVLGFMSIRSTPARVMGLRWHRWPSVFAIAPVTVIAVWIVMIFISLTGLITWLQEITGGAPVQESVKMLAESQDTLAVVLMSVIAVVVAPVVEEVLFRGYIYTVSKRYCGPFGAALFSSLFFAAIHGDAAPLIPLFILAIALCVVYEMTGSIWAPIAVHALFNGITVVVQLASSGKL